MEVYTQKRSGVSRIYKQTELCQSHSMHQPCQQVVDRGKGVTTHAVQVILMFF